MKFGCSSTPEKSTNVLRPCSCGLSLEEVLDLDRLKIVQLKHGYCQNHCAGTSHGICGMPLGAHHSNGNCFIPILDISALLLAVYSCVFPLCYRI
jgi:hypothetical protein